MADRTSRAYWHARNEANLAIADRLADSHLSRLHRHYLDTIEKVDRVVNRLYVGMMSEGGITTTNLYRFGRWAQLKDSIESLLQIQGQYEVDIAYTALERVYGDIIEKSYKDLGSSLKWGFTEQSQLKKAIDSVWSGEHFSSRIWRNTNDLGRRLEQHIKDLVSLGKMPDDIKRELMQDFNVTLFQADRLVRTEAMYQLNQAQGQAYQNNGITEYQFLAAHDARTSDICRNTDGQIFKFNEAVAGQNYPPLHPFCRSTIIPVIQL